MSLNFREYERDFEAGSNGTPAATSSKRSTPDSESFKLTLSAREKLAEFKKNSGRRLVSMKNQLASRYK